MALIGTACMGGSSAGPAGAGGASGNLMTPNPKRVSVTLDSAKAAKALIPVTGGAVTATGSDGSVYTLTVPDGALGGDEMVTMTPLTAATGLPFAGGLIAGVQLEPDGLQLFRMATLTIKPAKDVPVAKQVAIGYHGSGDNLYMQPLDPTAGISIHILHFSGAGVASGITGEIDEQAKHPPADAADQAAQQMAAESNAALAALRQAALLGTGQPPNQDAIDKILKGTLDRWFDQVVEPKVAAAQADYTLTYDALQSAFAWQRQVELLGAEDGHKAQIARLTGQMEALRAAYEKAVADRCLSKHDLSAVVELLSLEREFQLLGVKSAAAASPLDTLRKCLRFELDFETVEPFVTSEGETFILHDRVSKIVLEPAFPSGNLSASRAHEILGVTSVCPCRRYDKPVNAAPFTVSNLSFHMHFMLRRGSKSAPPITGVALTIDTGEVTGVRYDATSNTQIGARTVQVPAYECPSYETLNVMACWSERHRSERLSGSTTSFVIPMDFVGTGLFARKTYDLPCTEYLTDCNAPNEMTTFDLRHVPAT